MLENVDDGVNDHKSTSPLDDFWCGLRVSKSAAYTYKVRSRTSLVELGAGAGGVIRRVSMSMHVGVACVRVWWSDRRRLPVLILALARAVLGMRVTQEGIVENGRMSE